MRERLSPVEAIIIRGGALYKGNGLTPDGKTNYWIFVRSIIKLEKRALSEQIGILDGYKRFYAGEECLQGLGQGALLAVNYF